MASDDDTAPRAAVIEVARCYGRFVDRLITALPRADGWQVNDIGLKAAPDNKIEARVRQTQAVIWSKDSGFANRARQSPGPRVVCPRIGNTMNTSLRERLALLLTTTAAPCR